MLYICIYWWKIRFHYDLILHLPFCWISVWNRIIDIFNDMQHGGTFFLVGTFFKDSNVLKRQNHDITRFVNIVVICKAHHIWNIGQSLVICSFYLYPFYDMKYCIISGIPLTVYQYLKDTNNRTMSINYMSDHSLHSILLYYFTTYFRFTHFF